MKLGLVVSTVIACAVSSMVVACSGDDSAAGPPGPDSGPSAAETASSTSTPPTEDAKDGGAVPPSGDEDGGLITDGGGNPDEEADAGLVGDAGGGSTCGPQAGNGAAFDSTCSSNAILVLGGTITPGTYDLTGFTVLGDAGYCGTYKPSAYSGRLDITEDGNGGFVVGERVAKTGGISLFPNKSFDAKVEGKTLKVSQTCGPKINSTSWSFNTTLTNGKPTLVYTHDSGTATVRYRWVMR